MSYLSNPGSFEDIVDLLVPELQKRGMYWMDYPAPGGTARENMQVKVMGNKERPTDNPLIPGSPHLPLEHTSGKFKFNYEDLLRVQQEMTDDKPGAATSAVREPAEKSEFNKDNSFTDGPKTGPNVLVTGIELSI
jgi:hypothetical protein